MAAYGCDIAPPISEGHNLRDSKQRTWTVGKAIGSGGFGAIYLCQPGNTKVVGDDAEYVVKIEPHSNGPLFVEMHVFTRLAQDHQVAEWRPRQSNKPQGWVGIPRFYGHGSTVVSGMRLRFLVMTRFGSDIEKFFQSGKKPIPLATVLNIGIQIINSLEYIHSKGYTHNDIKAQNLLLDKGGCDVFLVDFGLSCRFKDALGFHHEGGEDERFAHEGTLEYTSRDGHIGAHSRRGDLETLGYNLVHWTCGFLPWKNTEDPQNVQTQKNGFLENVETFLRKCFKPDPYPEVLLEYFSYICELEFKSKPDYKKMRRILGRTLDELGSAPHSKLQFGKKVKIRRGRQSDVIPMILEEVPTRATRSQDESQKVFWQDILDPESILKSASKSNMDEDSGGVDPRREAAEQERDKMALENPTPEMLKLLMMKSRLEEERVKLGWKEQLAEFNKRSQALKAKFASLDLRPRYNTPVMEEVIAARAGRLAAGHHTPETSDDEMDVTDGESVREPGSGPGVHFKLTPSIETPATVRARSVRAAALKSTLKQTKAEPELLTPMAPRTRLKARGATTEPVRKTRSCRSQKLSSSPLSLPPSCLPTPSDTAPPSPIPGLRQVSCQLCDKMMLERAIQRHLTTVHKVKRTPSSIQSTPEWSLSGGPPSSAQRERSASVASLNSGQRNARKRSSPLTIEPDSHCLPRRLRRDLHIQQVFSTPDSPSKNIRVAPCPVCGTQIAKSLIPKHFQDFHSPSNSRRTRSVANREGSEASLEELEDRERTEVRAKVRARAKVSVSSDSPEKIRNFDSPGRPRLSKEAVGSIVRTFKRGLVL